MFSSRNIHFAILGIILDHKNEGAVFVTAVGDFLSQQSDRVVIVRDLKFGRVDAQDCGSEIASVIVHEANEREIRQAALGIFRIKFAFPFFKAVVVGKRVVEAPKINICVRRKYRACRVGDLRLG